MADEFDPAHLQAAYDVALEWGPTGARAPSGAQVAVVVDVLSFTTAVTVGVAQGMTIWPFPWKDERGEAFAAEHDATLARGRSDGLSPAALLYGRPVRRLVLPSPNGSTIAAALAGSGATVVAASLRNASAVARWVGSRRVAIVPAGERWPDDTLRPAVEDLWGAGAVASALEDAGRVLSPEARVAADAFRAVQERLGAQLEACASGRELAAKGYADDVRLGAELDADDVVPVLTDGAFVQAGFHG